MAESILHFGGIRLRVTGSGNLIPTLYSLDSVRSQVLVSLVMSVTNQREPTRLSNFISQRAMLKISTTAINEVFQIGRIIIYVKPLYSDFPG